MTRFAHLAQRLFNVPLAIHPRKAEVVVHAIGQRFGLAAPILLRGRPAMLEDDEDFAEPAAQRACEIVDGICIVPVQGTLVHKLGTLQPFSGMTGYDGIRHNVAAALADPAVRAIVLDIDSPGGEVSGCFDLVDFITAARGAKPVWAILSETAYSAAYAIASAADIVAVPRTGGTGSIGVVAMHVDLSRALNAAGVTITLIQYGARKTDGAETKPLDDAALEHIQADIDRMGELFVATVARNRALDPDRVRGQQAATFQGAAGIAAGLADICLAPDEAFALLRNELSN